MLFNISLFGNIDPEKQRELYKNSLNTGDIYLKDFKEADHHKMFIIAGISSEKIFVCAIFINSAIHPSIANKPKIKQLQVPLLKSRNEFLKYDSFANCAFPIHLETEAITKGIVDKSCKFIGNIHSQDLGFVQNAIINSGILTPEQIELYFKK